MRPADGLGHRQNGTTLPWSRFVALGDSLTEGVGDPVAGRGQLRGWADRLVQTLRTLDPQLRYWNLARRSLRTAEVREEQLGLALELKPDLASAAVGMNDILAPNFDAGSYGRELIAIVRPLRRAGATVLMGSFPPDLPALRLMRRDSARKFRVRLHEASEAARSVAAEEGALFMEAPDGWRYTMSECSLDGCHPNARGHVHIAQLALEALRLEGGLEARIDRDGCGWVSTSTRHLTWLTSQAYPRRASARARRKLPA